MGSESNQNGTLRYKLRRIKLPLNPQNTRNCLELSRKNTKQRQARPQS